MQHVWAILTQFILYLVAGIWGKEAVPPGGTYDFIWQSNESREMW
jgi:hypothetical protein